MFRQEVVVGYFSGKESVIPPERGTLAPDEPLFLWKEALLHQMNHSCARQAMSQGQG